jgi:hypothetical protein
MTAGGDGGQDAPVTPDHNVNAREALDTSRTAESVTRETNGDDAAKGKEAKVAMSFSSSQSYVN